MVSCCFDTSMAISSFQLQAFGSLCSLGPVGCRQFRAVESILHAVWLWLGLARAVMCDVAVVHSNICRGLSRAVFGHLSVSKLKLFALQGVVV
jgi:hypothetical protein